MSKDELVELKFRIYDGSDIGPFRYSPATTVAMVKERIISEWPKDKKIVPKTAGEVKLISSGRILETTRTIGEYRVPLGDLQNTVITMHVVVQPSSKKTKTEMVDEVPRKNLCSCSIM